MEKLTRYVNTHGSQGYVWVCVHTDKWQALKTAYQSEATQLGFGLVAHKTFCVTP